MANGKATVYNIALVGNPNCGKTTIFNRLTGKHGEVGNFSGVTVEKAEGRLGQGAVEYNFVDLPGVYSLSSCSKDETVTRDYLLYERPDVIVNVVDASNFERNLFLTLQLRELGIPLLIVLNMCDLAKARGVVYDLNRLTSSFGVPVIEAVGSSGVGVKQIPAAALEIIGIEVKQDREKSLIRYSDNIEVEIAKISDALDSIASKADLEGLCVGKTLGIEWLIQGRRPKNQFVAGLCGRIEESYVVTREKADVSARRRWLAVKLLEHDDEAIESWPYPELTDVVVAATSKISSEKIPVAALFASERYSIVKKIFSCAVRNIKNERVLWSDRIDSVLTHPVWGLVIFFLAMYFVFWLTFALGNYPAGWLEALFERLAKYCNEIWSDSPDSLLRSMIVDGMIGGVGGIVTFFPNIFILFAAIAILEESGYMSRGAFLTDRFLRRFGLTGKSFIPMLVGFGCSVPAVMATRIIEDRKTRLCTVFIIPLMSCGARFPIYMLIIPAFFAEKWQAPVLWCVYFVGVVLAVVVSSVLAKTTFQNEHSPLLIELPAYHKPTLRKVVVRALERGFQYLQKAGTTILCVSLLLWAAATFPVLPKSSLAQYEQNKVRLLKEAELLDVDIANEKLVQADKFVNEVERDRPNETDVRLSKLCEQWEQNENEKEKAQLEYSCAGRIGKTLEPVIQYAGFDWRIGTAFVGALAAKEMFVAQISIFFKTGSVKGNSRTLHDMIADNYSPLAGICIILFCLVGAPCLSTFVVVAKEVSWRWALAQWVTLTTLGFLLAVATFQIGSRFI